MNDFSFNFHRSPTKEGEKSKYTKTKLLPKVHNQELGMYNLFLSYISISSLFLDFLEEIIFSQFMKTSLHLKIFLIR